MEGGCVRCYGAYKGLLLFRGENLVAELVVLADLQANTRAFAPDAVGSCSTGTQYQYWHHLEIWSTDAQQQ
jgi:hypothetical protein